MSCVKVKFQDLTCNLAGTRPKARPVFGRVPFDITPTADGYRYHRRSRLRPPPSTEAAQGQCSAQTVPGPMHRTSGAGPRARVPVSIIFLDVHIPYIVIMHNGSPGCFIPTVQFFFAQQRLVAILRFMRKSLPSCVHRNRYHARTFM